MNKPIKCQKDSPLQTVVADPGCHVRAVCPFCGETIEAVYPDVHLPGLRVTQSCKHFSDFIRGHGQDVAFFIGWSDEINGP